MYSCRFCSSIYPSTWSTFFFSIVHNTDPDWDSDSDDDDEDDPNQQIVKEILEEAKKQQQDGSKSSNRRSNKRNSGGGSIRNAVLYIGHLPYQFEEAELAGFLKQFGGIVNLKVVRSVKTGRSRGYAFAQMKSPDTAAIIADTLSGYIVMGTKRLVCHVVPADKVHRGLFARTKNLTPKAIQEKKKQPQTKSLGKIKQVTSRLVQRERKKREALKEMGIDYDFPGYEESFEKMEQQKVKDTEEGLSDKKKKRKDSTSSVASAQSDTSASKKKKQKKKKRRSDSIASVESAVSNSSNNSKRKRKDSFASIESVQSEGLKTKKRPTSSVDVEEEASSAKKSVKKSLKKSKKRRSI